MKVLNAMETEMVSGAVCENMSLQQCIAGAGGQAIQEARDFGSGWASMWGDFGIWLYNSTHGC